CRSWPPTGLPSTHTTSPAATCVPSVATTPLIVTRPASMRASASRREHRPVSLMYLFSRKTLRRRNELIVTLMFPLELQEIVIPADLAVGIAPADVGPCVVDGAAAFVPVEEAAHGLVDVVLMVAQDLLVARSIAVREALLRLGLSHAEVPRQALDVELAHGDAIVTAAIARALETVVARHDPILCKVTKLKAY